MRFTEFLWKLLATAVVIGITGVWVALHAQSGSALRDYSYFVVGACTLVGLVSMMLAVISHIWQYKPRSRRHCADQNSN
ncbi:hypothetical protein SAMN05444321_5954 [Bradyrhizobium lablabi]|nr:hypothetical protein SAMN05444321_5954 [Bradyrhizobium lablabi]